MSTELLQPAEPHALAGAERAGNAIPGPAGLAAAPPAGPVDTRPSWLVPSIPDLAYIGLTVVLLVHAPVILLNRDGDLPRHIATGRIMLENRALVVADHFSHTRFAEPFLAYEWLSQLIFAAVAGIGGIAAVAVFAAAVIAAAYALLMAFMLRRGVDPIHAAIVLVAASALVLTHWAARPHIFSFVGCVLLLPFLAPGANSRRALLALPLFAVWANLHPGFVYGLGLLGVMLAGDLVELLTGADRGVWLQRARFHGTALVLGSLGTLLTPFGIDLHLHTIGHAGAAWMTANTVEFMPPDFHSLGGQLFLAVLLLVVAIVALRPKRLDAPLLLLLLVTLAAGLYALRNVALFGVVTLPLLAAAMPGSWSRLSLHQLRRISWTLAMGQRSARHGVWAGVATLLLAGLAITGGRGFGRQLVADGLDEERFPVAAVAAARQAGIQGRLFNHFTWGGYLTLYWPEQRVFIDGFSDFYGEAVFTDYLRVAGLQPGWDSILDRWQIELALLPTASSLAHALEREPGWRERYRDDVAVLLEKAGTVEPAVIP